MNANALGAVLRPASVAIDTKAGAALATGGAHESSKFRNLG
jgi:hypothetical protein